MLHAAVPPHALPNSQSIASKGQPAEASRYCVRRHAVVDADCWFNSLYVRAVPSHAVELAAVYMDRGVAAVLVYAPDMMASPQEKQDLAAFIHLCGGDPPGPSCAVASK